MVARDIGVDIMSRKQDHVCLKAVLESILTDSALIEQITGQEGMSGVDENCNPVSALLLVIPCYEASIN